MQGYRNSDKNVGRAHEEEDCPMAQTALIKQPAGPILAIH